MEIKTARFGTLDIEENKIVTFSEGIPGFEDQKKFFFFDSEQSRPIIWMQSVTDEHIALPVINPFIVNPGYELDLRDNEVEELGIESENDIMVWVVALVPEDITKITVNLSAPIIVNGRLAAGKQFVTDVKEYDVRYPVFEQLVKYLEGENADAGAVEEN